MVFTKQNVNFFIVPYCISLSSLITKTQLFCSTSMLATYITRKVHTLKLKANGKQFVTFKQAWTQTSWNYFELSSFQDKPNKGSCVPLAKNLVDSWFCFNAWDSCVWSKRIFFWGTATFPSSTVATKKCSWHSVRKKKKFTECSLNVREILTSVYKIRLKRLQNSVKIL